MARTMIGQLILRLRAEGLNEGRKVEQVMRNVEATARRLSAAGTASWGVGFQRQLNALKLSPADIDKVQRSWVALHDSIKKRNLSSALGKAEISHWKTHTLSNLAAFRTEYGRHLDKVERSTRGHARRMEGLLKPLMVMGGGYTLAYMSGILGREALTASSERRREIFRYQMMGVSEADQDKLFETSETLGHKYPSASITDIAELSRAAISTMGTAERAAQVVEAMLQALVVTQSTRGPGAAGDQLRQMVRGLDILGINREGQRGVDDVVHLIDAAVRASQVDPDFDPAGYFGFARRAKVAGPALSLDFLARAPTYMQDLGADTTGNTLAMAFKAFLLEAVGSAGGKKYIEERERLGIRSGSGLHDSLLFGSDPDVWVQKHLVPALKRDGVDLDDNTAVAAAVGKLSGNTNATAMLTRMITQREQTERWLRIMDNAMGLDAAEGARHQDPFIGWASFKSSLENLSASLIPIDKINAGLNSLADGINRFAAAAKEDALGYSLVAGGAAYGTFKGAQYLWRKADLFGLRSSALALDGSAAALTRAAVALGGASVADGPGGKKGVGGWAAALGALAGWTALYLGAAATIPSGSPDNEYVNASDEERQRMRDEARDATQKHNNGEGPSAWERFWLGKAADDDFNFRDHMAINAGVDAAKTAGSEMESALNITAKPEVDTSSIDAAIAKARQLLDALTSAASASAAANANVGAELRRNFAD